MRPASADVIFQYVAQSSTYNVAENSQTTVNLYLQQTWTKGSASFLASENGLSGAGFELGEVSGNTASYQILPTNTTGQFVGTAGYGNNNPPSGSPTPNGFGSAGIYAASPNGPASIDFFETQSIVGSPTTGPGATLSTTGEVYLGSVVVNAGATPGQTIFYIGYVSITAGDQGTGPAGGNTLTVNSLFDLDITPTGLNPAYIGTDQAPTFEFTFNVEAAVPEPSSLILLGSVIAGAGEARWLKRRNAKRLPTTAA